MSVQARTCATQQPPRVDKSDVVGGADASWADLACLRESTYRLLSQALLYPDEARVRALRRAGGDLEREKEALAQFAFFPTLRRLGKSLDELRPGGVPELQSTFVRLFSVAPGGVPCPPYESVYREAAGEPAGRLLAEVEATYAVAGLAAASDLGELPDHVSIELEFMAILSGQEADVWEREGLSVALKLLKRQHRFLRRHLTLWLPAFARGVEQADPGGFYAAVATTCNAFVGYDVDLVEALVAGLAAADALHEEALSS